MIKRSLVNTVLVFAISAAVALAQNANSSQTVRPRTTATTTNTNKSTSDAQKSTDVQQPTTAKPAVRRAEAKPRVVAAEAPGSQSVIAAFNALLNGIRHAEVDAVSSVY